VAKGNGDGVGSFGAAGGEAIDDGGFWATGAGEGAIGLCEVVATIGTGAGAIGVGGALATTGAGLGGAAGATGAALGTAA
jgi:hypothetical protein